MWPSLFSVISTVAALLSAGSDLRWDFESPREVVSVSNMCGAVVENGALKGLSRWDPYFYLRLFAGGIKAADFRSLQVRLFSSEPADLLDVYYKTAAGYWCLGGTLPIRAGWAVYTVDLMANQWRETDQGDQARKWGGPDGNICSLRLDPGNQAGRWVMVDWVRLTGEALPTHVEIEPRLQAELTAVTAPEKVEAGQAIRVVLTFDFRSIGKLTEATAYARLEAPEVLVAAVDKSIKATPGKQTRVVLDLPTLPLLATKARLVAGIYEAFDPDAGYADRHGEVRIVCAPRKPHDFPLSRVRPVGGSPAVYVDGKPIPLFCFSAPTAFSQLDPAAKSVHAQMAEAGIRIFSDWFGSSHDGFLGHVAPHQYDYSAFDVYFARVLQVAPNALFLPHVYVTPPVWWQKAHPDDMCRYHDGTVGLQSFASKRWRQEMGDDLSRLIRHFRQSPYAERIIGLVICSGYTAEWQSWGLWQDKFVDYSDVGIAAWRDWLRTRYRGDEELRKAWGRGDVSLATAVPPSAQRRREAFHLMLRDPRQDGDVIDYLTFLNELTADSILHFARIARKASDGRLVVGTYYGYLTQHHCHQAESGHCGIEAVLASPDLDFLMSPPLYTERQAGAVSGFMSATDSVHAHGKIWLSEADYRTHLSDPTAGYGRTETLEETLGVLWREFAHVLTKRAGVSWMDMNGGWLSGPDIPKELGKMLSLMGDALAHRRPWHSEVAVFIDPHSFYYVRPGPVGMYLTLYPIVNLLRAGAPFDVYVFSDLWQTRIPQYKLYVFLNAYALDTQARAEITKHTRRGGVSALWHWAAGYVWPDRASLASDEDMADLLGLRVVRVDEEMNVRLAPADQAPSYASRIASLTDAMNPTVPLGPLFIPQEGHVLATLSVVSSVAPNMPASGAAQRPEVQGGSSSLADGAPALVRQRVGDAQLFYAVLPVLPSAVLRQIYADVGVHVYLDADDCFYADSQWVGVHASRDGPRTLDFPFPVALRSVRSGFRASGRWITLNLPARSTELFCIERGQE